MSIIFRTIYEILIVTYGEPRCFIQYRDIGTVRAVRGSNPGRCKRFSFLLKRPEGHLGPPSLLFNGLGPLLPGVKCPWLMSSTNLTLLPKLRMSGAVPLLPVYVFMAVRYGSHSLVISVRSCFICSCHFCDELAV